MVEIEISIAFDFDTDSDVDGLFSKFATTTSNGGGSHMNITITVDDLHLTAQLAATATSEKILAVLPLEGRAHTWGEEIYFEIPVDAQLADDAVTEVEVGTLAYWPTGRALCIFFGPTPVSTGNLPRAYSPVNVVGKITGDAGVLKKVRDGAVVKVLK